MGVGTTCPTSCGRKALRERISDIPLLAQHFFERISQDCPRKVQRIGEAAMAIHIIEKT